MSTPTEILTANQSAAQTPPNFMWAELTGECQLACEHCYAESGPTGTHGSMTNEDWKRTIDGAATLGVQHVQFIGGEPTRHPGLPRLIDHARQRSLGVEVFSNLLHVSPELWDRFEQPDVSLATSYYAADPDTHNAITKGPGSHRRTEANIAEATRRGIPLRVGIIGVRAGQDIEGARQRLIDLGVEPRRIGTDHLRQVGRGVRSKPVPETAGELCGNCADSVVAVLPDGSVQPCVFSRQPEFTIGNARENTLDEIWNGERSVAVRSLLKQKFFGDPTACRPSNCKPGCQPELGDCPPNCRPSTNPCAPDACKPQCTPNTEPCKPYDCKPTR